MYQLAVYIAVAFCLSAVCGVITIPLIINFCNKKKLYDEPNIRKIHKNSIPRLGGISFLPSMLLALLAATAFYNSSLVDKQLQFKLWSVYFFVSLLLIYSVGIIDDLIGIGAKTKFAFQIVAAILLPLSGLYINNLYGFLGIYEIPYVLGAPLTVLIMVFIVNAINLIDGIDGLSASIAFIALTGFLYIFMQFNIMPYSMLIASMMGVLVSFFYFNIWGNPQKHHKIFMGDSGSLTLGFILSFLTVKVMMKNPNVVQFSDTAVILAYSLLIVPSFDVLRVSLVRLMHKRPIFQADKNHIHHKLLRAGLSQGKALTTIIALSLTFIAVNIILSLYTSLNVIVLTDCIIWLLFHHATNRLITKRGKEVFAITTEEK